MFVYDSFLRTPYSVHRVSSDILSTALRPFSSVEHRISIAALGRHSFQEQRPIAKRKSETGKIASSWACSQRADKQADSLIMRVLPQVPPTLLVHWSYTPDRLGFRPHGLRAPWVAIFWWSSLCKGLSVIRKSCSALLRLGCF